MEICLTATGSSNGQLVGSEVASLPRGGEEVLINGGGHRARSGRVSSGGSARHHQPAKHHHHLYTSSSIDLAVTESAAKSKMDYTDSTVSTARPLASRHYLPLHTLHAHTNKCFICKLLLCPFALLHSLFLCSFHDFLSLYNESIYEDMDSIK